MSIGPLLAGGALVLLGLSSLPALLRACWPYVLFSPGLDSQQGGSVEPATFKVVTVCWGWRRGRSRCLKAELKQREPSEKLGLFVVLPVSEWMHF